jgi:hypothetical protein
MNKRALKLPDGGTFDLPIPSGFGAPIFALNDAGAQQTPTWIVYAIGAGLGILITWVLRSKA